MSAESEFYTRLHGAEGVKPTAPSEGSVVEADLKDADPDLSKPVTIRTVFTHHDTHPMVIDLALMKMFGLEWFDWDPATINSEVKRAFKTELSELARAKIQTVKTLHVSEMPWKEWQVFEKIIQGLNNNIPAWEFMQAPSLEQLYAGIDIMNTIRVHTFSDEVKLYMAASVLHEEVTFVPPPLDFIQLEIAHPHYTCRVCGHEESSLFSDGVCSVCSKKFSPDKGLSMLPDPALLQQGIGKEVDVYVKHNHSMVERRWDDLKGKPLASIEFQETAEDIQVAKLLIARDYMNIRRRQLADQLTSLKSWLGAA